MSRPWGYLVHVCTSSFGRGRKGTYDPHPALVLKSSTIKERDFRSCEVIGSGNPEILVRGDGGQSE